MPWLLILCLHKNPSHQQHQYSLWWICGSLSSTKDFNHLCHLDIEKWGDYISSSNTHTHTYIYVYINSITKVPFPPDAIGLNSLNRVTHICVDELTITGWDNGMSPGRHEAIIWINTGISLIGPLGTNFSEILIEIQVFSFKKMHLSSANGYPFCVGLDVSTSLLSVVYLTLIISDHCGHLGAIAIPIMYFPGIGSDSRLVLVF